MNHRIDYRCVEAFLSYGGLVGLRIVYMYSIMHLCTVPDKSFRSPLF